MFLVWCLLLRSGLNISVLQASTEFNHSFGFLISFLKWVVAHDFFVLCDKFLVWYWAFLWELIAYLNWLYYPKDLLVRHDRLVATLSRDDTFIRIFFCVTLLGLSEFLRFSWQICFGSWLFKVEVFLRWLFIKFLMNLLTHYDIEFFKSELLKTISHGVESAFLK